MRTTLVALALAGALCARAPAGIVPVGAPIAGQSWGQRFVYEAPTGSILELGARIVSGGPFETPAIREFDAAGWRLTYENAPVAPTLGFAGTQTNPVNRLGFQIWFASEPIDPVAFLFAVWQPGQQRPSETFKLNWAGAGGLHGGWTDCMWSIGPGVWDNPTIPAPAAALLGVVGLGLVGWVRRRLA